MTEAAAAPSGPDRAGALDSPARRSMAGAVAWLGGGEIASRLVAFGTATLLARRLGPEGFGALGFAFALCSYFAVAVGGGLSDFGARNVSRRPGDAGPIYWSVVAVRLPLALAALALLSLVAWWIPRTATQQIVIVASGLSLLSLALDPSWVIKALDRARLAAWAMILSQLTVLAGMATLVLSPADVVLVPVVQFAVEAATALALAAIVLGLKPSSARPSEGVALWRESAPLLVGRGLRAIIVSFDMVLLGFLASSQDVGLYAAAYRLHFFVLALVVALQAAYLPAMARAATRGASDLGHVAGDAMATAAVIGAPLVAGGLVVAGPLLAFLFGVPYAEGARALQWLLVSLMFVFVHGLLHNVYVVTGTTDVEARWFAAAAVVNVLANLWLIPRFGIAGAAAATTLAEAVIVGGGILGSRLTSATAVLGVWAKPACAAAGMAAVVWATRNVLPLPAQCVLGAVVYGVAVVGLVGPRATAERFGMQLP